MCRSVKRPLSVRLDQYKIIVIHKTYRYIIGEIKTGCDDRQKLWQIELLIIYTPSLFRKRACKIFMYFQLK